MKSFEAVKDLLDNSYSESRAAPREIRDEAFALAGKLRAKGVSELTVRAETLSYLLRCAPVKIDGNQFFADGLIAEGVMTDMRGERQRAVDPGEISETVDRYKTERDELLIEANADYGHLCPDWNALMSLGYLGIAGRARAYKAKNPEKGEFYDVCAMIYDSMSVLARRLSEKAGKAAPETASNLRNIAMNPPKTLGEALQLYYLTFRVFEYVDGERIRSLGGVDGILAPFYRSDVFGGASDEDERELMRYFLYQCWSEHVPFDLPFYIGERGAEDFARLLVGVYSSLDIYSPKLHVRVREDSDDGLLKAVLDSVRRGNSSFVFISDETAVKALVGCGIEESDARNYVPIGCYEPAAYGCEIPCTGNSNVNLGKAVEHVMRSGLDYPDFESFRDALTAEISRACGICAEIVRAYERRYPEVYPIPMLSATYESCLESGVDALAGGAKYNNSSCAFMGFATAADSLCAVKRAVYDEKRFTLAELRRMLSSDWEGFETERRYMLTKCPKYGSGSEEADQIARRLCSDIADCCSKLENARGGRFKAGLFSIDKHHPLGRKTGATPDGRKNGEPLSKNTGASQGMDKAGVTALIRSASSLPMDRFPDGSVLDIMLHPASVSGEEGLCAMLALIRGFFAGGGFAIHGNVLSSETLEAAQKEPEKYASLQVRLCGWNVYFVNLTKPEQDELILAAK